MVHIENMTLDTRSPRDEGPGNNHLLMCANSSDSVSLPVEGIFEVVNLNASGDAAVRHRVHRLEFPVFGANHHNVVTPTGKVYVAWRRHECRISHEYRLKAHLHSSKFNGSLHGLGIPGGGCTIVP